MAPAETPYTNSGPILSLGARADVFSDQPLPEYDSAGGQAYAARLRNDARSDLVAIICTTGLPVRSDLVNAMRTIDNPGILRLKENAVLQWPAHHASYYALAYERPFAPRYWRNLNEIKTPLTEDASNHYFVTPMIGTLLELQRTGIVHGAIRPTNIFWRDSGMTVPQLGECLSAPAGVGQPALFEPVERGMCTPIGRGPGNHVDDCYAFGVTLALLILGQNPFVEMEDAAIVDAKIEKGTFNAIVGTRRLATSHIELLRGLLTDDPRQRWTATDLEQWLSGRRLTPKNTDSGRRASRHFELAGKNYLQIRPLAAAMAANVSESVKLVENATLEKWLYRSLGDEDRAKEINEAILKLKESGKTSNYDDMLVTQTCIALDPPAPIRYRGLSVMPGGIAAALAESMLRGTNMQALSEIISGQFVTTWVNLQKDIKTELVPIAQQLERMRGFIEKTSFGNGVERVAYDLNPTLPCLSQMLRSHYVMSAKQILPALEIVAGQPNRPREPVDRHIAAFMIAREKRGEALFEAMSAPEGSARRGIAMLTLFADMQYRHGPDHVPNLAAWILPFLEPSFKRFLSKPMQEKIRKQAKDAVTAGNLNTLLNLVDDPKRMDRDEQEFLMARQMYFDVLREISVLEMKLNDRESVARAVGRPVAATIASVISILLISYTFLRAIFQTWR